MLTESDVTRFCIYTENISPTDSRLSGMGITPEVLVANQFDGYTLSRSTGMWNGQSEGTIKFEIFGQDDVRKRVVRVAEEIRERCGQEAVIVTADRVLQYLITGA